MDHLKSNLAAGKAMDLQVYDDSILPVIASGQASLVDMEHRVSEGVRLEPSPGHTPGHVSVWIESLGQAAVAIGDVMHHPIQFRYPELNSVYCLDPERAIATRRRILDQVSDDGTWLLPAHFDPCRVSRRREGYRFRFH